MTDERTKTERFRAFRAGWRDGVCARKGDKRFLDHPNREDLASAYDRGWSAGRDATSVALIREAERMDYNPMMSVLRADPYLEPVLEPAPTCDSSCTFRDDEHNTYNCELPAGHDGCHESGVATWT